jgi:hypothetical protein
MKHLKNIDPGGSVLYLLEVDSDNVIPISAKNIVCIGWFSTYDRKKDFFIIHYTGEYLGLYYYYYRDRVFKKETDPLIKWIANRKEFFFYCNGNVPVYWSSGFSYFRGENPYEIKVATEKDKTRIIGEIPGPGSIHEWKEFELLKDQCCNRENIRPVTTESVKYKVIGNIWVDREVVQSGEGGNERWQARKIKI